MITINIVSEGKVRDTVKKVAKKGVDEYKKSDHSDKLLAQTVGAGAAASLAAPLVGLDPMSGLATGLAIPHTYDTTKNIAKGTYGKLKKLMKKK